MILSLLRQPQISPCGPLSLDTLGSREILLNTAMDSAAMWTAFGSRYHQQVRLQQSHPTAVIFAECCAGETGGHHYHHDLQLPLSSVTSQHGVPAALLPPSIYPAERGDVRSSLPEYQRSLHPRPSLLSNLPGGAKHISVLTSHLLILELIRLRGVRLRAGEERDVRGETQ